MAKIYRFLGKFGSAGTGNGQFNEAGGIAVDSSYIYVADRYNYRIQIFNKTTFAFVGKFGSYGTLNTQFLDPKDVAVDANYIYVADFSINGKIKIFNKITYAFVSEFVVGNATDPAPYNIALDTNYIYTVKVFAFPSFTQYNIASPHTFVSSFSLTETGSESLTVSLDRIYSSNGQTLSIYNKTTNALITTITPCVAATVDTNYIYITSANKVQVYNLSTFSLVEFFGSSGSTDGQFMMESGSYIAIYNNIIYVNDNGNNRIQVFDWASMTAPAAPSNLTLSCAIGNKVLVGWTDNS